MAVFTSNGQTLEEISNSEVPRSRFSRNLPDENVQLRPQPQQRSRTRSPTKSAFSKFRSKSRDPSPEKPPRKQKSATNLVGLLSRPKTLKGLQKVSVNELVKELEGRDKENITPKEAPQQPPTPIFAQFASNESRKTGSEDGAVRSGEENLPTKSRPEAKQRPKSFQVQAHWRSNPPGQEGAGAGSAGQRPMERGRSTFANPFSANFHTRSKSTTSIPMMAAGSGEPELSPEQIDKHLDAMLDRRNIPENQRYKMRDLNNTIKMEFIRQDWAEMQVPKSNAIVGGQEDEEKKKRSRGKSFTFSRGRKDDKDGNASKKSKGEGTLGRHFRSKSTDGITYEPPLSSGPASSSTSLFTKLKAQQTPSDYVSYLRKIQKPELVEVGKLHKLRLLLRNETVAWIEDFIQQGGMAEIVGLLRRIIEVEWREEHEDALLHENLLCLKALSTTARAVEYLHTIQGDLFPELLGMLFDPEHKGPSEFTTRSIITSVLFTYMESVPPGERMARARILLQHLRDPELKEAERPLPFVMDMRQERPYRVWCKEAVSVTKEVFWIFLHNLNVVSLPSERRAEDDGSNGPSRTDGSYMQRHFPRQRSPVPAAPYVGGVEWDATNYLASHLDLMNAILACTPSAEERNLIRAQLRISGWERCLGGSLRLCKEKFYGSVHDGLRTWVAAAADDGWDVRDVRYGPNASGRSSPKKSGGQKKKKDEEAPRIDFPKLDVGLGQPDEPKDAWLS